MANKGCFSKPETNHAVINNLKNNNESEQLDEAFFELLNREIQVLYSPLINFVARQIGNASAQDILHDAVIVLILKAKDGKLKNKLAIKPFLYSTVRWLIRTYRLKNKRYVAVDQEALYESLEDDKYDGVDAKIESRELKKDVFKYIDKLTQSRDQQLLLLHYWYEKPEAFMDEYQVNSNHYARLLYRAKQRLGKVITSSL